MEGRTMKDKVVRWPGEHLVHTSQRFGEHRREKFELSLLALFEVAGMSLGKDPHFKRKARGIGGDAEELRILRHDAIAVREVLPDNVTIDAALFLLKVSPASLNFFCHVGGDDREGNELRMAVFQRGTGCGSVILEYQNISEPHVLLQINHAITIRPEDVLDPFNWHIGQAILVVRRLDDDFMCADPIHAIVETEALAVEVAFDLECGELVRHNTHGPVRTVGLYWLCPVCHNFSRCQSLLTRAKWAEGCSQRSSGLHGNKVVRPTAPFRRNYDPPTDNRVTS